MELYYASGPDLIPFVASRPLKKKIQGPASSHNSKKPPDYLNNCAVPVAVLASSLEEGGIKGGWRSGCGEGQTVVASVEMELKTVEAEPLIHVEVRC